MNQIKMTPEQLQLLSEAAESLEALFKIINMFNASRNSDNAAARFEEGFDWLQKVIGMGELKVETLAVPNVLDPENKTEVA
jgi:hypothetical protein